MAGAPACEVVIVPGVSDVNGTSVIVGEGGTVEVLVGAANAVWVREEANVDTASVRTAFGFTVGVNSASLGPHAVSSKLMMSKTSVITGLRIDIIC